MDENEQCVNLQCIINVKEILLIIAILLVPFIFYNQVNIFFINIFDIILSSFYGIDVNDFYNATGGIGSFVLIKAAYNTMIVALIIFTLGIILLIIRSLINKYSHFNDLVENMFFSIIIIFYMYFIISFIKIVNFI